MNGTIMGMTHIRTVHAKFLQNGYKIMSGFYSYQKAN